MNAHAQRFAKTYLVLGCILLVLFLTACASNDENSAASETGGSDNNNQEEANNNDNNNDNDDNDNNNDAILDDDPEPVEILMMTHWDDGAFEATFKEQVEAEYPHITLNHVQSRHDEIEELFAAQIYPDIIMSTDLTLYNDMDLLIDLYPHIDQTNFDLDRMEPGIMEYLYETSNEGELNGLPYIRPDYALVYNPDVFDAFGVSYPEDGMYWDEIIELASDVTGEVDGVHYYGLHHGEFDFIRRQVPNSRLVNPDTHEPYIEDNDAFREMLHKLERIYSIPGNFDTYEEYDEGRPVNLMREGVMAMAADRAFTGAYVDNYLENGVEFDFVTFPKWGGEFGEYGPNEPGNGLVITNTGNHPEEAFRVVSFLLGDEHQRWQSSTGNVPGVTTQEVLDAFLVEHEHYEDVLQHRNISAMVSNNPAPVQPASIHEGEILEGTNYMERLFEGADVNTIVREMQDIAEGNYEAVMGAN